MYYTYILRCDDNSLYTGITNDINKRIYSHYKKLRDCAKYTRSHQVVKIEKIFMTNEKNLSAKIEFHFKRLPKDKKEQVIKNPELLKVYLSDKIEGLDFSIYETSLQEVIKNNEK